MDSTTVRGVVRGGLVILDPDAKIEDETKVLVTPLPAEAPGTGAAIIAALDATPRVPAEWVDEFEALIAAGRRPATRDNPFHEELPGGGRSP